jgi:RNA polymerase sigma-70 factor (sigma-E family)
MARRDTVAFTEFVAARSASLFRTAYLMVGERDLAEDLVQEALTKTYVAWPRLRDVSKAEAYTRKAITTTYISWWRRKSWAAERPRDDVPDRPGDRPEHGSEVVDRAWLWEELQQLPPRQRAAIVLRYYEDLSEAETAEAMRCSVAAVKSMTARAMQALRERIGSDER